MIDSFLRLLNFHQTHLLQQKEKADNLLLDNSNFIKSWSVLSTTLEIRKHFSFRKKNVWNASVTSQKTMESQGKFLLSGTALVIWICTSWRHFELIWALQQMTRLLLLRRGLWCTKGIQFPQAFFTDCIWEKLYRKKARQRWKVALFCYPCCHYTLLSDWHFTKKGAPPSIHYCSHWLFFYAFLGPFYTSQGEERVCKKADNKGKINWKLLQILPKK